MEERRIDDVSCEKGGLSKRTRVKWGVGRSGLEKGEAIVMG